MRTLVVILVTGVFAVSANVPGAGAVSVTPGEVAACRKWASARLGSDSGQVAFSFTYGGRPSTALLPEWPKEHSSQALDAQRDLSCEGRGRVGGEGAVGGRVGDRWPHGDGAGSPGGGHCDIPATVTDLL